MRACEEEPCGWCEQNDSDLKGFEFVLYLLRVAVRVCV